MDTLGQDYFIISCIFSTSLFYICPSVFKIRNKFYVFMKNVVLVFHDVTQL